MTTQELLNMVADKSEQQQKNFITAFFKEVASRDEDDQTVADEIYSRMFDSTDPKPGVQDFTKSGSMR